MWSLYAAHNFGEFYLHVVPRLWALQRDGVLDAAATLVIGAPAGERLPDFMPALLAPFTPHAVVSFSEVG